MNYPFQATCLIPFEDNEIYLNYPERWTHNYSFQGSLDSRAFFFLFYKHIFLLDRLQYNASVTDFVSPIPGLQIPALPVVTSTVFSGQVVASQSSILKSVKKWTEGIESWSVAGHEVATHQPKHNHSMYSRRNRYQGEEEKIVKQVLWMP